MSLIALPILAGCGFKRETLNMSNPFERIERVKVGQTRLEELIAILGTEPSNIIPIPPDRKGYVFGFGDAKTARFGLILVSFEKTNAGFDTAVFVVDDDGVVQRVIHGSNSQDLKWEFWPFGGGS